MATPSFFAQLQARVDAVDSLLCVGLDPHVADLGDAPTAQGAYDFCRRLVDATAPYAAAFKPNAAFFEVFGAAGSDALKRLIADVPAGIPVVLDAKRGDIATTAEAYAEASYALYRAHAVTLSGYMGVDSIAPFLADASKGVFVLCKTSNPSADELQVLPVAAGGGGSRALYEVVAGLAAGPWGGASRVGLVVGATDATALRRARAAGGDCWILAPGVGFQGGDLAAALAAGLRRDGSGMLLPVSRGVSRAADPAAAARQLRDQINAVRASVRAAAATAAAAPPSAAPPSVLDALSPHQREFIGCALQLGVLRFGSFTLKSGRVSPYFFNAGAFRSGSALAMLGRTYAAAIAGSGVAFDVLFGPAYKGIPLVTAAAVALAGLPPAAGGRDVPVAYNRKEAKDHGEGGVMVGAELAGRRVLIVDDVISAGTAIGESVALLRAAGAVPVGVVIGLDRQERGGGESALSAVQAVTAAYGIPVHAVVTLDHLLAFLAEAAAGGPAARGAGLQDGAACYSGLALGELLAQVTQYRAVYGVAAGAAAAAGGGSTATGGQ